MSQPPISSRHSWLRTLPDDAETYHVRRPLFVPHRAAIFPNEFDHRIADESITPPSATSPSSSIIIIPRLRIDTTTSLPSPRVPTRTPGPSHNGRHPPPLAARLPDRTNPTAYHSPNHRASATLRFIRRRTAPSRATPLSAVSVSPPCHIVEWCRAIENLKH